MSLIKENVEQIRENIKRAALKSGRSEDDITLIGVTKTVGCERINELLDVGVFNLGENRVQELLSKYDELGSRPTWHLIGQLQTNKVKYIADKVSLIHSVDSVKLASEINKHALKLGKIIDVLVEINVAGEGTKAGIAPDETRRFIEDISGFSNIFIKGLMTIAPYVENPEENRGNFSIMRELFIDKALILGDNVDMHVLSMGMTGDYEVAIEEGSTMVRIGTGIFGSR
ncbi:MAG: YggS family pyridoxal phosphate-dependent enzyme [Defluviitaleaceae bacterium]|nr:YggS family pyridoxal phosphate-dependent enzyme [Defluviitaleaceae bacterium]